MKKVKRILRKVGSFAYNTYPVLLLVISITWWIMSIIKKEHPPLWASALWLLIFWSATNSDRNYYKTVTRYHDMLDKALNPRRRPTPEEDDDPIPSFESNWSKL